MLKFKRQNDVSNYQNIIHLKLKCGWDNVNINNKNVTKKTYKFYVWYRSTESPFLTVDKRI